MLKLIATLQDIGNPKFIKDGHFYGQRIGGKIIKFSLKSHEETTLAGDEGRVSLRYFDEDYYYFGDPYKSYQSIKKSFQTGETTELNYSLLGNNNSGILVRSRVVENEQSKKIFYSWIDNDGHQKWSIEREKEPQLVLTEDTAFFFGPGNGYDLESINLADGSTNWAFKSASLPTYAGTYGEAKADGYLHYVGVFENTLFFALNSGNLCTINKDGSDWTFHRFNPLWFKPGGATFLGRSLYYFEKDAIIEYDLDTRIITSHANLGIGLPGSFYSPTKPIFFSHYFLKADRDTVYNVNLAERKLIDSFSLAGIEHFNGAIWNIQYSENHLLVQDYDKTVFVFAFEAPE